MQSNDRRKEDYANHQGQNQPHHRNSSFNRKRYQQTESLHSSARQDQNRGDWKRSRFDGGKSNWVSQLDQELWDGPNVEFQRQNSRGGYRRGRGSRGDYHMHRTRDFPPMKERYPVKSEVRNPALVSGENSMDPALTVERPT